MATEDDADVPETGAIFTFGKSKFGDNSPCKFWLKNDQVSRVCCGDEHTALVTENGRIFMFGSNEWGQLGLGHTKTVTKPTRIKDKTIKEEKVKLIGCGRHHTILATEGGKLYSFGGNADGQLGLGADDSQPVTKPQYIEALRVRNFKMLSCGAEHSAALTEDGKLYLWGGGSEGQLGLGQTTETAEPTLLPFDEAIVYVACGYYHTAFVTESGKLYTFGETDCGKLGQGEDPPSHREAQVVQGIGGPVVSVACGGSHTVAITGLGRVYTFGDGSNGQLGHGTTILVADTPQELSWGKKLKVKYASCGENSTSLITDKGQLYTFGDGRHGKLALGEENFANQFTPSLVLRFAKFTVQKVSCGGCHMLAIAKVRTENGVKEDWEDSEDEDDIDATPSNNLESSLRKSADLSGGSLDLSGSIAARNRRREKLPDPMGTMNRTLPPLSSSWRGLPHLDQTQPLVDDTLSKKTLPQIHKLEEPESKSVKPAGREEKHRERKKEDTEEEESSEVSVTEESSEDEEENKKPALVRKTTGEPTERAPQPKPRAMPRKSRQEEESSAESAEDEESEDSEEEEKVDRKKHLKQEEEKKEEVNKAKVKPKPASRRMTKEQEKKSEDSEELSEEETEEEEDEDSEEEVGKKKLSKKKAAEEDKRKKKAGKKEKEKKKKPKPISLFGRRRITQTSEDNDSSDDDDDEEEEEVEKQKKSKSAKDKNDKKKTKKDKNKKSDENSEDEDEDEEDEDDEKDKKTKGKDKKNKKGKKKTKENDSEDKEDDEGSDEEEEGDKKDEKKSDGTKELEGKESKTCTIL